jgi:rhamnogalacturonyl hydrolase YesR
MKKILTSCILLAACLTGYAQTGTIKASSQTEYGAERVTDISESAFSLEEPLVVGKAWMAHGGRFALWTEGERQYVVYYNSDRRTVAAQRLLSENKWTEIVLPSKVDHAPRFGKDVSSTIASFDAHNSIAMAVDSAGYIHVTLNHHVSRLTYFRSTKAYDITTLVQVDAMVGDGSQQEDRVTYPKFMTAPTGELLVHYRHGSSGSGYEIYNIYNVKNQTWSRFLDESLISGEGRRNAYQVGPTLGPDGWYHMGWVWRDTGKAATSHSPSYARSRDLINWETVAGDPLTLPIKFGDMGTRIDPIPIKSGIINGGLQLGFDSKKGLVATYHKFDEDGMTEVYAARFKDGAWDRRKISDWNYRWDFKGAGTLTFMLGIKSARPYGNGELAMNYRHNVLGDGVLVFDQETFEPLRVEAPVPSHPAELDVVQSDFPGMAVYFVGDSGDPSSGYKLRWECLVHENDHRRPVTDKPSDLTLYKMKRVQAQSSGSKHPGKKDTEFSLDTLEGRLRAAADYQISVIVPDDEIRRRDKPGYRWLGHNVGGWRSGTLHLGLFKLWELTKDPKYMDQMMAVGNLRKFKPTPRMTAADDLCIGQMYLRLYEVYQEPRMLEQMKEAAKLTAEKTTEREKTRDPSKLKHGGKGGGDVWSFADALFMSPPNWALLIKITGDPDGKYADYLEKIYKRNWDFLFDARYQLYYRDTHRIGKNPPEFWGRGNGWVMGSLALVLEKLPKDHALWPVFAERLRLLSEGIAKCELPEGGFGISLMNNKTYPEVELSATALVCFGMTFGLNNGILPKEKYEPIVRRAWKKVFAMQTPDGAMRQCQQGGVDPRRFDPQNNENYGTGAFLLFASEFIKFAKIDMAEKTGETYARYVPERIDDFAWENDNIAFRAYGPKARKGAENSGIDCWLKRVDYPIIDKWYGQMKTKSYHKDWGEGHDPYHVGSSAGCGGTGIWLNGKREPLETYTKQELIECTPQRSQFKLTYEREIGDDVYGEEKTITIEPGKRLFDVHSVFTRNGKVASGLPVCIGLTTHDGKAETFSNEKQG